jgi:copper(I)-binding protein
MIARLRLAGAAVAAVAVLAAGCVYNPSVVDTGGVRIQPQKGRLVARPPGAEFYADIASTGKYGDVLTRAESTIARRAQLLGPDGAVSEITIPGETVVHFAPGGYRVALSELKRPLEKGEVVIVTLYFQKSGGIGVISVVE